MTHWEVTITQIEVAYITTWVVLVIWLVGSTLWGKRKKKHERIKSQSRQGG